LAVGPTEGKGTKIYAGINSSEKEQALGNNQHFRTFKLEAIAATKKTTATSKILEKNRIKLFQGTEPDAYQRVTRLSKPFPKSHQLGVVATGAGLNSKQPELVLFDTSGSGAPNVRGRAQLSKEAKDVDVIQTGKDQYTFAYCTDYEVFAKKISSKTEPTNPKCVYVTPGSQDIQKPTVASFRCIRFLSPEFLVMLTNIYGRNGVAVQILRLPPGTEGQCSVAESIRLPSHIKQAAGLSVCNLSPPKSPSDPQLDGQFVIAVASQDISISLFTCNYQRVGSVQMIVELKPLQTISSVHPLQMTGIAFSGFEVPKEGVQPKDLKLASISMGNTVVVHTIPLIKHKRQGKLSYVASIPSSGPFPASLILLIVLTLFGAFIGQVTMEIRGSSPRYIGIQEHHLQPDVVYFLKHPILNGVIGEPRPTANPVPRAKSWAEHTVVGNAAADFASSLSALHAERTASAGEDGSAAPVIIIRDTPHVTNPEVDSSIKADLHDEAVHGPHDGKTWEELSEHEKETWTQKLKDAGHWAEDFGETVFKGVLFGAIGGMLG
jgi:hypothetical protein